MQARAAILCVLLLLASSAAPRAQAPSGEPDRVTPVLPDDAAMIEAKRKARETLAGFLDTSQHPQPGTDSYAVKVGLGPDGGIIEYFWISPFTLVGDMVSGRLGQDPVSLPSLRKGDPIKVPKFRIIDWMYYDHNVARGAFTACALLSHDSADERAAFIRANRLDCDK
jgi:uncharacterized protein YegJ (DUF2314 family)